MILIYKKLLFSIYELTNDFFSTVLLISILNSILTKLIESFFANKISEIKKFNDFISFKEKTLKNRKNIYNLHSKFNYNPLFRLVYVLPLIIQLPFLISIYYAVLEFDFFNGKEFLFINDVSKSDGLFYGINLLPFIMFFINIIIIKMNKKEISKGDLIFPALFLFILYNSPSSLLIYWTISQILNYFLPVVKINRKIYYTYTIILIPFYLFKIDFLNNIFNILFLLIIIFFIENIIKSKLDKFKYLIIPIIFSVFYSYILQDLIILFLQKTEIIYRGQLFYTMWRFQYSLILGLILSFFFSFLKQRKIRVIFKIIILSILITGIYKNPKTLMYKAENAKVLKSIKTKKNKGSIVLIVLDEYASPLELTDLLSEKEVFYFSKRLCDDNWIVKNNFHSNEISTSVSMFSIFNYNLSGKQILKDLTKSVLYTNFIKNDFYFNSSLLKDLRQNDFKMESYGLFNFNLERNDNFKPKWIIEDMKLFYNLKNFSSIFSFMDESKFFYDIFSKSIFSRINGRYKIETFRNSIFDYFNNEVVKKYDFVYYHFHMPHSPFRFKDEFLYDGTSTEQYAKFWKFTNNKFYDLLKKIKTDDNKIILIGDHGFRSSKSINPNKTFGAFYGFTSEEIEKIKVVQDVGLLIKNDSEK